MSPRGHLMKRYQGRRAPDGAIVTVDGQPLDPRLDLRNHGPAGFDWGHGGSGPAQLALAIATDHFGGEVGESIYQDLKWGVIAKIGTDEWTITSREIRDWYAETFPSGWGF